MGFRLCTALMTFSSLPQPHLQEKCSYFISATQLMELHLSFAISWHSIFILLWGEKHYMFYISCICVCIKQKKSSCNLDLDLWIWHILTFWAESHFGIWNKYWFIAKCFNSKLLFHFENSIKLAFAAEMSIWKKIFQLKLTYRNRTFWFKISVGSKNILCCCPKHFLFDCTHFHETRPSQHNNRKTTT